MLIGLETTNSILSDVSETENNIVKYSFDIEYHCLSEYDLSTTYINLVAY